MVRGNFERGLIFANGEFSPGDVPRPKAGDLIVCADGGLRHAMAIGLRPHVVLGDFDSLGHVEREFLQKEAGSIRLLRYPVEKDKTDGHLAVEYALRAGVKEILMFGGLGGRFDHTLGNLLLAWICLARGVPLQIVGQKQYVSMLKGPDRAEIRGKARDYVSLLPLTPTVIGVTTQGLYYPLDDAILYLGDTRGISNELVANIGSVEVRDGVLFILRVQRDD